VNVRTQFACLGVDDRELLFDSQSERVVLNAHGGLEMFLKNATMSCGAPRRDSRGAFYVRARLKHLPYRFSTFEHMIVA